MNQPKATSPPSPAASEPFDPLTYDYAAEEAVYQRERERLVREHLGKFALIRGNEFAGVYETFDEAIMEGRRRFGWGPLMIRDIIAEEEDSIYMPHVDINHPSFRRTS